MCRTSSISGVLLHVTATTTAISPHPKRKEGKRKTNNNKKKKKPRAAIGNVFFSFLNGFPIRVLDMLRSRYSHSCSTSKIENNQRWNPIQRPYTHTWHSTKKWKQVNLKKISNRRNLIVTKSGHPSMGCHQFCWSRQQPLDVEYQTSFVTSEPSLIWLRNTTQPGVYFSFLLITIRKYEWCGCGDISFSQPGPSKD